MPARKQKEELLLSTVSMTGYGRCVRSRNGLNVEIECKSLNSRYLDLVCRLPREYGQFEIELRELLARHVKRGRVELSVVRRAPQSANLKYQFNRDLFEEYLGICEKALAKKGRGKSLIDRQAAAQEALRRREVLDVVEEGSDAGKERDLLFEAVNRALLELCEARKREGRRIGHDMFARLPRLTALLEQAGKLAAKNGELLRDRLRNKISALALDRELEAGRLATEVAFLADRQDVTEELVRLGAHIGEIGASLGAGGAGRKIDFLLQECAREVNTLGAKTVELSLQELVLELKLELERLREQAQNLE